MAILDSGHQHCKRLGFLGLFLLVNLLSVGEVRAAVIAGTPLKSFAFESNDLVADPNQPYVFASVPNSDAIERHQHAIALCGKSDHFARNAPKYIARPGGQTLYVADSTNNSIDVIDTGTLALSRTLPLDGTPDAVVPGLDNRLYVLDSTTTYDHIEQINALTGAAAGPAYGFAMYYGRLQISPDQKTLYYAEKSLSPTDLYSYDVSTGTIAPLKSVQTGSNGKDVVLSHNGATIAQPNGAPYSVTLYNSSNFAALGSFDTGAYPDALAFSPGDNLAYVSHSPYPTAVDIYSTTTFNDVGQFSIADQSTCMTTDNTGGELYVALDGTYYSNTNTVVYATGAATPEPSTLALLGIGALGLFGYGWRRRRFARTAKPTTFDHQAAIVILPFPSQSSPASTARRAA